MCDRLTLETQMEAAEYQIADYPCDYKCNKRTQHGKALKEHGISNTCDKA
jgi:hypothetical protein